jgi:hypothetical protein
MKDIPFYLRKYYRLKSIPASSSDVGYVLQLVDHNEHVFREYNPDELLHEALEMLGFDV